MVDYAAEVGERSGMKLGRSNRFMGDTFSSPNSE